MLHDLNELLDTGRDRRSSYFKSILRFFFIFNININLLGDGKCDCVEHALPARDCLNDEILADNCLWS